MYKRPKNTQAGASVNRIIPRVWAFSLGNSSPIIGSESDAKPKAHGNKSKRVILNANLALCLASSNFLRAYDSDIAGTNDIPIAVVNIIGIDIIGIVIPVNCPNNALAATPV